MSITIEQYDPKVHKCETCGSQNTPECRTCPLPDIETKAINWTPREEPWVPLKQHDMFHLGYDYEVIGRKGDCIAVWDSNRCIVFSFTEGYIRQCATNIRRAPVEPLWRRLHYGMKLSVEQDGTWHALTVRGFLRFDDSKQTTVHDVEGWQVTLLDREWDTRVVEAPNA